MVMQPHLLSLSAYIDQNLDKDLALSSLARRIGLSRFHFHRKFGAYFGESLHQHIKRLRIERAAFELSYGSKPISDIALASGYKTVSSFSHAFSGYMEDSPTRYRARCAVKSGMAKTDGQSIEIASQATRPAWIGELEAQPFAFLRATARVGDVQPSVRDAIAEITRIVAPLPPTESIEFIVATTDFYGIVNAGDFRVDVGVDSAHVPPGREDELGKQALPVGRYARFDFTCAPDQLAAHCYRAAMYGLRGLSENSRTSTHFIRFLPRPTGADGGDEGDARTWRFFMPLTG